MSLVWKDMGTPFVNTKPPRGGLHRVRLHYCRGIGTIIVTAHPVISRRAFRVEKSRYCNNEISRFARNDNMAEWLPIIYQKIGVSN
jgi:hypothetical protein